MLLLALFACDDCSKVGDGWLEVGTGGVEFEPLEAGDLIAPTFGSQGGQHIWGSLRVAGILQGDALFFDAQNPEIDFQIFRGADLVAGYTDLKRHFAVNGDQMELIGETLFLEMYPERGDTLTIQATLLDKCGTELTDSVDVIYDGESGDTGYY
jgi:hypothetical protein